MVSKCANPDCSTPFHYLRDGKIFQLEIGEPNGPEPHLLSSRRPTHHVEHFWLCGPCAATMTLVIEKEKGVIAVPLRPHARQAAAS